MKLGLDVNPISPEELCCYSTADKTPLGYDKSDYAKETKPDYTSLEFWKGAPDGANYYWETSKSFYKFSNSEEDFVFDNDEWEPCLDISCFLSDDLFKRPQSTTQTPEEKEALDSIVNKPLVYTQEMADNCELPSVGSEFLHKGAVATTLSTSKEHGGVVTFTVDNGCSIDCCWNNDAWVKPIDTRTKKEKAIDELIKRTGSHNDNEYARGLLSSAYGEWVGE